MSPTTTEPRLGPRALAPGLAGALTLTLVHQGARGFLKHPPRMDVYGRRALRVLARYAGRKPARGRALQRQALVADVASNSLYYALVAMGPPRRPYLRGLLLGALAGLGAVRLGPRLGLGWRPARARASTALLMVAWYTLGGLGAAWATQRLLRREEAEALP